MIRCVHKTLPVGQAAPGTHPCSCWCICRALLPHALEGDTPPSRQQLEHLTCADEEEERTMDLHHPLAAVIQMEARTKQLWVSSEGAVLPKYTQQGIGLQHLFWEWQLRATAPPGWKREHSVFHPSNIFCGLQKVIFFLSINVVCDLLNKYTHR